MQALVAAGLDVPDTALCYNLREVRLAALRMGGYPIVVKMLESTHGVGVALAQSLFQLERIAEGFLQLQGRVILQEYIAESQGRDVRAFVVGNRIVAAMERRAQPGEFRANMHRGATATPIELDPADQTTVLTAAGTLGVEIAGVDLIPSRHGYLLMEVNASPGLEGIETTTNVDIAGAIIDYAVAKTSRMNDIQPLLIADGEFYPGQSGPVEIVAGQLPSGNAVSINAHVFRAYNTGPGVLILAGRTRRRDQRC